MFPPIFKSGVQKRARIKFETRKDSRIMILWYARTHKVPPYQIRKRGWH